MRPIEISRTDDPRISDFVSVRERDLTGRDGKFIIEGKVTLTTALTRSQFDIESVFLETGRYNVLETLLKTLPPTVPIYTADQSVMDQIVGFPIHRGILACGVKKPQTDLDHWLDTLDQAKPLVLCVGLSNHDNVGAVFRNAAALGASAIMLDEGCCDPLYRKSIRVSAGTALWMPSHFGEPADRLFAALHAKGYCLWTLTPNAGAMSLYKAKPSSKTCIVLGPEGPGLPQGLIDKGEAVSIPMSSDVDSLNVATALAVTLSWINASKTG